MSRRRYSRELAVEGQEQTARTASAVLAELVVVLLLLKLAVTDRKLLTDIEAHSASATLTVLRVTSLTVLEETRLTGHVAEVVLVRQMCTSERHFLATV